MSAGGLFVDAFVKWLLAHPDTGVLVLIGGGAYYEVHHGRIADMAENQYILGAAVYRLLSEHPETDEEQFREDLWGEENGGPYPRDWDTDGSD